MKKIKIQRYQLSQLVSYSETYNVSSTYRSGRATLTLDPDGTYNFSLRGDMSESTAKKNPNHKAAETRITTKMLNAYSSRENCFLCLHKKGKVNAESSYSIDNNVEKQRFYEWKSFPLTKPTKEEVALLVSQEEKNILHSTKNADMKYSSPSVEEVFQNRIEAWEEIHSLFNKIETSQANKVDSLYKCEFETRCQIQNDIINGEDSIIEEGVENLAVNIEIPFSLDLEYKYSKDTSCIDVDLELIENIEDFIPQNKALTKANGQISIKAKTQSEILQDVSICETSLLYYVAKAIFNISPNLKKCCLSLYTSRKIQGICYMVFDREKLRLKSLGNINPLEDINNWINIADIKYLKTTSRLEPIEAMTFKKLINNSK